MKYSHLLAELDRWDRRGVWAFTPQTLALMFPDESQRAREKALRSDPTHRPDLLVRVARGVYVNPRARSLPANVICQLPDLIRPTAFNYLSLESVLSDAGMISQIPGRLTVMSTARSDVFDTPFGAIEFVRTHRGQSTLREGVVFDETRGCHVATPVRALEDLAATRRNQGLVASAVPVDDMEHGRG